MLLMAILPLMLIVTIVIATKLDERGFLGPSLRVIGVVVPLSAIAASLSLGIAALLFVSVSAALALNFVLGAYTLVAGLFHLLWAQLYLAARKTWAALLGGIGTAVALAGALLLNLVGIRFADESAVVVVAFQFGLLLLLTPAIAPNFAAMLAEREMPVQRAVVFGAFGVSTVVLFTCLALVGAVLPA